MSDDETGKGEAEDTPRKKKWTPGVDPKKETAPSKRPRDRPEVPTRGEKWLPGIAPERAPREAPPTETPEAEKPPAPEGREGRPKWAPAHRPGEETTPTPGPKEDQTAEGLKRFQVTFDKDAVRKIIEKHFEVYDERDAFPGLGASVLTGYYIMGPPEDVEKRYPDLLDDLRALDDQLVPMLRVDQGETVIVIVRRPKREQKLPRLQIVLLLATFLSLVFSGSLAWAAYGGSADILDMLEWDNIVSGTWSFALPILFVLVVWELGRRIAGKRHRMQLGFPFFIPVPPLLFFPAVGTFGALSSERDPWPDRRAMFDVATAGPIAGFLAALPVVIIGLLLTNAVAVPVPDGHDLHLEVESPDGTLWEKDRVVLPTGNETEDENLTALIEKDDPERGTGHGGNVTWTYRVTLNETHVGDWVARAQSVGATGNPLSYSLNASLVANDTWQRLDNTTGSLGPGNATSITFQITEAMATNGTDLVVVLEYTIPDATTVALGESPVFGFLNELIVGDNPYVIHPMALAGWTALFVIGINLIPAGRFDGGLAARAVLGDRMKWLAYLSVGALFVLSFRYIGWTYLVLFILLFVGIQHTAPLNDAHHLDRKRKVWAVILLLLLLATFVWVPVAQPWFAAFA
ncbi:MAG: hypothetical protein KY455_06670 [Euryarchaeota archaeon]|nr:hypothetical protein [Euryarchaeota archaeon]